MEDSSFSLKYGWARMSILAKLALAVNALKHCRYLLFAVWSQWQRQSDCSRSCGGGILRLIRTCSGSSCPGPNTFDVPCNTRICVGKLNL